MSVHTRRSFHPSFFRLHTSPATLPSLFRRINLAAVNHRGHDPDNESQRLPEHSCLNTLPKGSPLSVPLSQFVRVTNPYLRP
jgi:hypothetical protein